MTKHRNIKTIYNGVKYDSLLESRYAQRLDLLKKAGEITSWRRQVSVTLKAYDSVICRHVIDFEVTLPDGSIEWHEVKGRELPVWKLKVKLFRAQYPDRIYRVIKEVA